MDQDYLYLLITIGILIGFAGASNLALDDQSSLEFGGCTTDVSCLGSDMSGYCLGIEQRETTCTASENLTATQRIEARCGAASYNVCQEGYTGTAWAENTTVEGQTCQQWADEEDIELLSCEQSFTHAENWDEIESSNALSGLVS
ncbi:MAG: hypothetical protein MUP66_03715 [Candidatus Nanohaloarchaeota archaeon QJJ-5]|nr:hypothetical protein [Candidatus Nanohaloarchaeota archaeon QJJ-5]